MWPVLEVLRAIVETLLTVIFQWKLLICLGVALLIGFSLTAFFPQAHWLLEASIVVGLVVGLFWEFKFKKN